VQAAWRAVPGDPVLAALALVRFVLLAAGRLDDARDEALLLRAALQGVPS
jgi:hypothetical protein